MTQKHFISWLVMALLCLPVFAQIQEPVKFKTELKTLSANEAEIIFSGAVENGWHIYSTDLPEGGPISATFNVDKIEGAEVAGKLMPRGNEIEKMDPIFEMKVRYFEKQATFVQKIKLTGGDYKIVGYLEYGACNDENCLPPTSVDFAFTGKAAGNASAAAETATTETVTTEVATDSMQTAAATVTPTGTADYWAPVIKELGSYGENINNESHTWIYIFFTGMLGGLLALFTPCVWPIIPMTVSFFLKRTKDKKKGIRDAWTYGASIVVIYVGLGLIITGIWGANALNSLSTNAIFNIFFCLMLVVFAASFFGASIVYGQLPGSGHRYAGLRHRAGFAFHPLRAFPVLAEIHAEIRRMDERHQGDTGLPGTGLRPEVPVGCRSGLRLAHPGPRDLPGLVDCHLRPAGYVPARKNQVPAR